MLLMYLGKVSLVFIRKKKMENKNEQTADERKSYSNGSRR
jgi:hypothetical protein